MGLSGVEPGAGGALSLAGLQHHLSLSSVRSKNLNNSQSEVVSFRLSVEAHAQVSLNG